MSRDISYRKYFFWVSPHDICKEGISWRKTSRRKSFSFPPNFSRKTAFLRNWKFHEDREIPEKHVPDVHARRRTCPQPQAFDSILEAFYRGFPGGPASSSAFLANTKWGRFSWPFALKCRDEIPSCHRSSASLLNLFFTIHTIGHTHSAGNLVQAVHPVFDVGTICSAEHLYGKPL